MSLRTDTTRRDALAPHGSLGLLVCAGGAPFATPLDEGRAIVLGRDAELAIDDESVSRRHASVEWEDGVPWVCDLESRNGTRVDGHRLAAGERAALSVGVTILLGRIAVLVQPMERVRDVVMGRGRAAPTGLIALDPKMQALFALVELVGPSELPILILGETGAGKEVVANAIHACSNRGGALVAVSCAAMPTSLLEAELFGYERGAFTGAVQPKAGLIESADGGTLFLDEIGEAALETQAKLLRVLETGEVTRLGSVKPKRVDVRIVSATHQDLEVLQGERAFRADLFYRIAGMVLRVPPLRERPQDIGALATHFAAHFASKAARPPARLSARALAMLEAHSWPGNARELRNVMQRATVLCGTSSTIEPEHLALRTALPAASPVASNLRGAVDQFERARIVEALAETGGNQTKAAVLLGVARRTLVAKIEQHGINRPQK